MTKPTNAQKSIFAVRYAKHLLESVSVKDPDEFWTMTEMAIKIAKYRNEFNGRIFSKKYAREYLFDLFVNNKGLTE